MLLIAMDATFPHLCSGLSCCLCFGSHGSLQLVWQLHIFNLHSLHLDAPVVCGLVQVGLKNNKEGERFITLSSGSIVRISALKERAFPVGCQSYYVIRFLLVVMKLQRQPLQTVCIAAEGHEEEIGEATGTISRSFITPGCIKQKNGTEGFSLF